MRIPRGWCQCGCGTKTKLATSSSAKIGWMRGEPLRFIHGHNRIKTGPEFRIDKSGCWVWLLAKTSAGYGLRTFNGKLKYAHRKYYENKNGPMRRGLVIDHLCRNPSCVNPDHLEAVTDKDNIRRGNAAKLNYESVKFIRAMLATNIGSKIIADQFGVSRKTIDEVKFNRRWI